MINEVEWLLFFFCKFLVDFYVLSVGHNSHIGTHEEGSEEHREKQAENLFAVEIDVSWKSLLSFLANDEWLVQQSENDDRIFWGSQESWTEDIWDFFQTNVIIHGFNVRFFDIDTFTRNSKKKQKIFVLVLFPLSSSSRTKSPKNENETQTTN